MNVWAEDFDFWPAFVGGPFGVVIGALNWDQASSSLQVASTLKLQSELDFDGAVLWHPV